MTGVEGNKTGPLLDHERRGILELTMLLVTGQASQTLAGIFAGGESTSDRVRRHRWFSPDLSMSIRNSLGGDPLSRKR
jgi:hypothetical protein